jgi:exodeoxyribonuclease VIII
MSDLPKPGLHAVSWETYSSWDARRYSELRHFKRSPLHARYLALHPDEPTAAMSMGSAIHVAVLEPESFEKRYVEAIEVGDKRTPANKARWVAFEQENAGRGILKPSEWEAALRVRESVWSQPWAEELLGGAGANEVSALWMDAEWKIPCKCRIDRLGARVIDLKSTRDASASAFQRSISNFDYYLQAALYMDGLDTLHPSPREWIWIAVETVAPYAPALYSPTNEMIDEGRKRYRTALGQWAECTRSGFWPGYSPSPVQIDLPPWAKSKSFEGESSEDLF